jgi:hypothetical protein
MKLLDLDLWNPCYSNSLEDPLLTLPVVKVRNNYNHN